MEIHPKYKELYNQLKQEMLFACDWAKQENNEYGMSFELPFIAIRKINNQGSDAYIGVYLSACKNMGKDGFALKNADGTFQRQITLGNEAYKPEVIFSHADDRIFVTSDLDEIAERYLERYKKNRI